MLKNKFLIIVFVFLSFTLYSRTPKRLLRYKYTQGKVLIMKFKMQARYAQNNYTQNMNFTMKMKFVRVLNNGKIVKIKYRMIMPGYNRKLPYLYVLTNHGKLLRVEGMSGRLDRRGVAKNCFFALPKRPVGPGDKWYTRLDHREAEKIKAIAVFEKYITYQGKRMVLISYSSLKYQEDNGNKIKASGKFYFDYNQGVIKYWENLTKTYSRNNSLISVINVIGRTY